MSDCPYKNFKNKIADVKFVDNFESHKGIYEYIIKETNPQAYWCFARTKK